MASDTRAIHGPYPLQLGPKPVRIPPFFGGEALEPPKRSSDLISPPPSDFWSPIHGNVSSDASLGAGNEKLGRRRTLRRSALEDASPSSQPPPLRLGQKDSFLSERPRPKFFSKQYFDNGNDMLQSRRRYLRSYLVGLVLTVMTMMVALLLHWGALRGVPVRPLDGIVVDFDSGVVGLNLSMAILSSSRSPNIAWSYVAATAYPDGPGSLSRIVKGEQAWVVISINPDASQILNDALLLPDPDYDGALAVSVHLNEARSHSLFRDILLPQTTAALEAASSSFARNLARQVADSETIASVLKTSPQTLIKPLSYTVKNTLPEGQPITSISTSTGFVYLLVASFSIAMFGHRARNRSGLNKQLLLGSLIRLRFASSFAAFFFISLIYSALAKALHLNMDKMYGRSGFLVFWMLHWIGMSSVGLALEAMITLVTPCYLLYSVVIWAAVNVPTCLYPLEATSRFYRYGHLLPFYNMCQSVRTIALGTKNQVGLNFGVLILWVAISCVSMPVIQRRARLRHIRRLEEEEEIERLEAAPKASTAETPFSPVTREGVRWKEKEDAQAVVPELSGTPFRVLRRTHG